MGLDDAIAKARAGPRTLVIDIETMAPKWYAWRSNKQYLTLPQMIEPGRVICFAAKWVDEKRVLFYSEHHDGHTEMVAAAWKLLDDADVLVHYNGRRFDEKHLNRSFKQAGLSEPSSYRRVDLMTAYHKKFTTSMGSYKLDAILIDHGLERKLENDGWPLWVGCDEGDEKAWRDMRRYCMHDVKVTDQVRAEFWPWISGIPHQGLYSGTRAGCPSCGAMDPEQIGYVTTATGRYIEYRCRKCGGTHRGTHRVEAVHHVAL